MLYGPETETFRKVEKKYTESSDIVEGGINKVAGTDKKSNEDVLK